jgi:hypothetical protein
VRKLTATGTHDILVLDVIALFPSALATQLSAVCAGELLVINETVDEVASAFTSTDSDVSADDSGARKASLSSRKVFPSSGRIASDADVRELHA